MARKTYDDLITGIANGYSRIQPMFGENIVTTVTPAINNQAMGFSAWGRAMPSSLPSGVTAFIVTAIDLASSASNLAVLAGQMIDLGSLNIATPTFTDGSAMPTVTELGASNATYSAILAQVEVALNATPGNFTVTYVDQSGNTAETTTSAALPASAPINSAFWVPLNSGDVGARDITTATRTAGTTPTGTIRFWGILPLTLMYTSQSFGGTNQENLLTRVFNPIRLGVNDKVHAFTIGTTGTRTQMGSMYLIGDN